MSDLTMNILGFAAVNRDLEVAVREPVSQKVIKTVKPYLDGTVRVPGIDPGNYEIEIKHPNITLPVVRRPIRILPVGPTKVTVLIDPSKFRNTPIDDIPDANLAPLADMAQSVAETILPLSTKTPGEAIKSGDWNALALAVRDLANNQAEMTRLVTPVGHNHTELETKIEEMSTNFSDLLESMSRALTELQRQIQALRVRKQVEEVLDIAEVDTGSNVRKEWYDAIDRLGQDVTLPPRSFSRQSRNTGVQLGTLLEQLLDENADNDQLITSEVVTKTNEAITLLQNNRSNSYKGEISFNQRFDKQMGGSAFQVLKG